MRLLDCDVISRNVRRHGAEIDLLCKHRRHAEYFVFEVKKQGLGRAAAYPSVSRRQLERLVTAARTLQASADRMLTIRLCLLHVDLARGSIEVLTDVAPAPHF